MSRNFLVIDPEQRPDVLRALASPQRVRILRLLHNRPGLNVNDIAEALALPQSTRVVEPADPRTGRADPGRGAEGQEGPAEALLPCLRRRAGDVSRRSQCARRRTSSKWRCRSASTRVTKSARLAVCARPTGTIGLLDVPGSFLNPDRMNAGLMWFTRGFVEYQFPNNARHRRQVGRRARVLDGAIVRGAGDFSRLAVRHHGGDQWPRTRRHGPAPATMATCAASSRPTGGSSRAASTAC